MAANGVIGVMAGSSSVPITASVQYSSILLASFCLPSCILPFNLYFNLKFFSKYARVRSWCDVISSECIKSYFH